MPNHDYRRDLMGQAEILPGDAVIAGDWTSLKLIYTAGKFGIDDQGGLKVAMRTHSDMTPLQTTDPAAPGYLTVHTSIDSKIDYDFSYKKNIRPWGNCITVLCKEFLRPGDQVIFNIGDTSQGSPGVRMQTHCENQYQFRVTVDAFATVDYTPLEEHAQPFIRITPGKPALWKALLPTLRQVNQPFRLIIKSEDIWGNPSNKYSGTLSLKSNQPIQGLPATINFKEGEFAAEIENLIATEPGNYEIEVFENDEFLTCSNPLQIQLDNSFNHYWSDMHGQSGETIGSGTAREYFHFAKHRSFVDISAHQGNDFQISDAFWDEINELTAEFNEEGKFLCLPGYEWSGNTGLGGDHNIWYRHEGRPIYRSSRAIVNDKTRPESDCHDVKALFNALKGEDVLIVPHVGGRFADVSYAHDASLEPSVEVHSSWGSFDWIVQDSLEQGFRFGIVAGSDGHKGRPGASYPGDAKFGSYGGLTCHLLPELTRDSLFEHFRRRHHYATTGERLFMSAEMKFKTPAKCYVRNPEFDDSGFDLTETAILGDIVQCNENQADFNLQLVSPSPIEKVEVFDGLKLLKTWLPYESSDLGLRLRITCKGQETRGRSRLVNWKGQAILHGASIDRIVARNYFNPDNQPQVIGNNQVNWKCVTTGGFAAIDIWLSDEQKDARIEINTDQGNLDINLAELDLETVKLDCGGMDKQLLIKRLPKSLTQKDVELNLPIVIPETGDAAIFTRVTLENGHTAWSSPIYAFQQPRE